MEGYGEMAVMEIVYEFSWRNRTYTDDALPFTRSFVENRGQAVA